MKRNPPKKPKMMKFSGFAQMRKRKISHVGDSLDREFGGKLKAKSIKKKMPRWKLSGFGKMAKRLRRHVYASLDREFGPEVRYPYNTRL